jgi:hypothetical protein
MIKWQFFPKNEDTAPILKEVVKCFTTHEKELSSEGHSHVSNTILDTIRPCLIQSGFLVEDKKNKQIISVPVLFGINGIQEKKFNVDAYHPKFGIIIEIEAGRAIDNNQILKDFFEACMMINIQYLVIAVRKTYRKKNDFEIALSFFDALYSSGRIQTPLKGVMIIGY